MISFLPLSFVDLAGFILVFVGAIQGGFRGLSGELSRLVSLVVGFVTGISLYEPIGLWLSDRVDVQPRVGSMLAFLVTFGITLVFMAILRGLLRKTIRFVFTSGFDRITGVFAGMFRMGLLVFIFFLIMNLIPVAFLNDLFGERSLIGRGVVTVLPSVERAIERSGITLKNESLSESEDG